MAKEKPLEISLIEAENEANNGLLASFPTRSSDISSTFTRHLSYIEVSNNKEIWAKVIKKGLTPYYEVRSTT